MAHLIFLTGTPPTIAEGSGTWVGISVLRNAIEALGHQVTLIAPPPEARETPWSRILFNLRARAALRGRAADALVGFDLDGVFVTGGRLLHVAAIKGVLADEARHERGASRIALAIQSRLEARHVRNADRVIATSAYSADQIARLYGAKRERIFIVPELIDLDTWERSLRQAPRAGGELRILCVAHLYPRKGVDTLIRAFARIRGRAVLRIVGAGPERARLEYLAEDLAITDEVQFLGDVPYRELVAEYRSASIFALPTSQEGFGIVFLEAMASSLPVVAGRAGAVPEVVAEGETALLVEPEDDVGVAEALRTLIDRPALRLAMGRAGFERVRQYDAPLVARRFLAAVGMKSPAARP